MCPLRHRAVAFDAAAPFRVIPSFHYDNCGVSTSDDEYVIDLVHGDDSVVSGITTDDGNSSVTLAECVTLIGP